MRHWLCWALVLVMLGMAQAQSASAQTPKRIDGQGDWTVYEVTDSRGRVCYLASEPSNQTGNYSRRDNPAVLVVRLPGKTGEYATVHPGYPYRKDSKVKVTIEGRDFELFTDGEHAFTYDADDESIVEAMKRGGTMTVRGTSTKGTYSLDTYSLKGFTAALDAMRGACVK
jgi:invasion protein IalB